MNTPKHWSGLIDRVVDRFNKIAEAVETIAPTAVRLTIVLGVATTEIIGAYTYFAESHKKPAIYEHAPAQEMKCFAREQESFDIETLRKHLTYS